MIFDAGTPERAAFARMFDVCVIGSGPAGITLARTLAARGLEVALMEAGGLEPTEQSQDVYVGENAGLGYHDLDAARLRYFGGSSGHWNGLCRALDAADFQPNPRDSLSGWPIARTDLDPYEPATAEILDLAPLGSPAEIAEPPVPGDEFRQIRFRRSAPTRFGEKYLAEITASERIFLALNANLVDLRLEDSGGGGLARASRAVFKSYAPEDPGFAVEARVFCLCTGGIENARLLLNFDSQAPAGVGNGADLVGRHFCEHPSLFLGEVLFEATPAEENTFYTSTEAFRAARDVLGISFRLQLRTRRAMSPFTESGRSLRCAMPFIDRLAEEVLRFEQVRCDLGGVMEYGRAFLPERYPWGLVTTNSEQSLNPDSRVTLSGARDAFGLRRVELRWELRPIDYRTIKLTTLAFARTLAETGAGRLRLYDWLLAEEPVLPGMTDNLGNIGSWHHMCTTRMSDDPATGVVDRDCRVHGMDNLYIGGSSVFATAGYANPTYTIVQLALRLSDHLARELRT